MTTPTTITRLLLIALVAGVAAETTGCVPTGTSSRAVTPDRQAAVRIQNENRHDVRVFQLPGDGGHPVWIGTIGSLNTKQIPLHVPVARSENHDGSVRFLISPLRSTGIFLTHPITVGPGDMVRITVTKQLALSTCTVSDHLGDRKS